ncbi:MAG: hypothetical protein VCB77_09070, partial [Alphaproteobacteria bacterium]
SLPVAEDVPRDVYPAMGFRVFDRLALRTDAVERVAAMARRLSQAGSFVPGADLLALAGCDGEALAPVLTALGYRAEAPDAQGLVSFAALKRRHRKTPNRTKHKLRGKKSGPVVDPDSPFAKLANLRLNT